MNVEAPIIAAQAATTVRDTAAVASTMGFLRSIATAVSVVIGGVIFQNEMKDINSQIIDQLGSQIASRFNGSQAPANIELIGTLPGNQQFVFRKAYFEALRTVRIMVCGKCFSPFACRLWETLVYLFKIGYSINSAEVTRKCLYVEERFLATARKYNSTPLGDDSCSHQYLFRGIGIHDQIRTRGTNQHS